MVYVSKQALGLRESIKLFAQLNNTIGSLNEKQSAQFLGQFLGQEEQIMLAKRLAAILMLNSNQTLYKVAHTLKISTSTAENFQTKLNAGAYEHMIKAIQKDNAGYLELLLAVDSILHLGGILPHYGQTHASEQYKKRLKKDL